MLSKHITLALCAGLVGLSACAHDSKPRERTSVSAVTNEEATARREEPASKRMRYTEVDNEEALGRKGTQTGVANGAASGTAADAEACELAVYFDTDSARLDKASEQRLDKVADCIKRRDIDHATIVGQTDPSGAEQRNRDLGLERARVVAAYLRARGVPEDQIRVRSKGEVASAAPVELWPVERRAAVDVKR